MIENYKCRAEFLYDISLLIYKLYEYPEYENIRILKTIILVEMGEYTWEFGSNKTLEELIEMITTINDDNNADLHRLYETINYKDLYNGDCIRY